MPRSLASLRIIRDRTCNLYGRGKFCQGSVVISANRPRHRTCSYQRRECDPGRGRGVRLTRVSANPEVGRIERSRANRLTHGEFNPGLVTTVVRYYPKCNCFVKTIAKVSFRSLLRMETLSFVFEIVDNFARSFFLLGSEFQNTFRDDQNFASGWLSPFIGARLGFKSRYNCPCELAINYFKLIQA